jgi:hypothetical protein
MRKINIFNRNTNLPSYRRKPVSGGFNCNGEIPRFRGMTGKARGVAECKFPSREGWRVAPAGVWFAVIAAILIATPSFAAPTELDKRTVASKAYVDTKQDIIETDLVTFHEPEESIDYDVPALVSYGTGTNNADGVLGNKIGVVGLENGGFGLTFLATDMDMWDSSATEYDNFVPTVRSVVNALKDTLDDIPTYWYPFVWSNAFPAAINAYSVTFNGTTNNWPSDQSGHLVPADTFVNSLALKQNKIPAGTAGNVVTYTGTAGTVGSVAVSSTENYNQQNQLTNGSNLANVQLVSTKQNKMVCAGWDSETHTDEHCWLWSIE